jgi:hypothetical protein
VDLQLFLLIIVIVTALGFDFTNGFHDTGNAMATSIASGALKPRVAVGISAVLNLVGAFLSTAVPPRSPRASSMLTSSPWSSCSQASSAASSGTC